VQQATGRLRGALPVWVVAASAAVLLLLVYMGFRLAINSASDQAFSGLRALDVKAAPLVQAPPPATPPPPRLATLLQADINAGLLQVRDLPDKSIVIIKGDGLFEPGRAEVVSSLQPLLGRIGAALKAQKGPVLITGHTDNQPIRSLRFPSNWHLSQARAQACLALLAQQVEPARLRAEGRAEAEPADDNATPAGRAHNRRVEVTLLVQEKSNP
jgi:type VI secretion system protein ImpK